MRFAARFEIGECGDPKCQAIHFWLFESTTRGIEPFACMTVDCDDVLKLTEKMRDVAYTKIASRDG